MWDCSRKRFPYWRSSLFSGIRRTHRIGGRCRLWMRLPDRCQSKLSRWRYAHPPNSTASFEAITRERADGVLFIADPIFFIQLKRMVDLVAGNRLPAICNFIEFPKLGGLMGYAPSIPDEFPCDTTRPQYSSIRQ